MASRNGVRVAGLQRQPIAEITVTAVTAVMLVLENDVALVLTRHWTIAND